MEYGNVPGMLRLDKTGLVRDYENYLVEEERSRNTITKYMRDLKSYFIFLQGEAVTKESLVCWKEKLTQTYLPASVNSMLISLHSFLRYIGQQDCCVKLLKIQRQIFAKEEKELSCQEYQRLVKAAGNTRLSFVLRTICGTGSPCQ